MAVQHAAKLVFLIVALNIVVAIGGDEQNGGESQPQSTVTTNVAPIQTPNVSESVAPVAQSSAPPVPLDPTVTILIPTSAANKLAVTTKPPFKPGVIIRKPLPQWARSTHSLCLSCQKSHSNIIKENWLELQKCWNKYLSTRKECLSSKNRKWEPSAECSKWFAPNQFNILSNSTVPNRLKHLDCILTQMRSVHITKCYVSCTGPEPSVDEKNDWKICSDIADNRFSECYYV